MLLLYATWIGGAAALVAFVALVYLYRRNERKERFRLRQTKADIADIMILFQTMRDVTKQQKSLARDFNEEIDRKMGVVKEVLTRGLEKNKQLYERQQNLVREIETMRAELLRLQNLVQQLQRSARDTASPRPEADTETDDDVPPARPRKNVDLWPTPNPETPQEGDESSRAFISLPRDTQNTPTPDDARLRGTGITEAPFREWMGMDFDAALAKSDAETPKPHRELYGEVEEPSAPSDPAHARQAFRDLLDYSDAPGPQEGTPTNGGSAASDTDGVSPVQKRVLEYYRAGMTVAQIAKELGIGKGEVRLMLSLAQPKQG